jgi:hypothetical protein
MTRIFCILNPGTPALQAATIYSHKELQNIKGGKDIVFLVNIHLNWDGHALGSDHGFDVANWIRTSRTSRYKLSPIIFFSYLPQQYFVSESETKLKYKLLFGRGSGFLEAPFSESQLKNAIALTAPLTEASLHDVATMLADVKGVVLDRLNHDLKFGADVHSVFREAGQFLSTRQKALIQYEEFVVRLTAESDDSKFYEIRDAFLGLCNNVLTETGDQNARARDDKPHILVLDDRERDLQQALIHLDRQFNVTRTRHAAEAIRILEDDVANQILGVVADWRLYEDESPYWQSYQGYEVLELAARTGHRALFALTSQADFVVHQIRNLMGIRFHLVKKQNLRTKEQWDLFSDVIQTGCTDAKARISEIPTSKTWSKSVDGVSYRQLYLEATSRVDSIDFFRSVEEKARLVWNYIEESSKSGFKDLKLIKDQFGLEVPRKQLNLTTVLVLRLVWLRLWYEIDTGSIKRLNEEEDDQLLQVFRILCQGYWRGYIDRSNALVELNKLALSIKDIQQKRILPHERAWLLHSDVLAA